MYQIRIDQLPAAGAANLGHTVPVMIGGTSFRLTIQQIADLIITAIDGGAPVPLNTLKKLADAVGNDPSFAATTATALAARLQKSLNLADLANKATARDNLEVLAYVTQALTAAQKARARANIDAHLLDGFRNKLINGDGLIFQRGNPNVADDQYGPDRHYALTESALINLNTTGAVGLPAGLRSVIRLTQNQATAQRMGCAQIIESYETQTLRNKTVTLGGKLRCNSATPIRFAVLEWGGALDVVTSDVVNNWASASYTAGGFFISANCTVLAVGSITPAANTFTDWALTASVSANASNIVVMIWTQDQAPATRFLDFRWYLVEGDATGEAAAGTDPFSARSYGQEFAFCQRFYQAGDVRQRWVAVATENIAYFQSIASMRAQPTIATTVVTATNVSAHSISPISAAALQHTVTATAAAATDSRLSYTCDAEL